ncbi:hypothetical protein N9O40_00135 [Planktomarina sp.]|nr:hypothetical protein [Planktomarina sp.]
MKNLLTIFTFLFTVMIPSISFAEWTEVSTNTSGHTFYVDFERIRKHDGYVYFWRLRDNLKPDEFGDLSAKVYYEGDCKLFRFKTLSYSFHKEPMGGGTGDVQEPVKKGWKYPEPDSVSEIYLKEVCSQ